MIQPLFSAVAPATFATRPARTQILFGNDNAPTKPSADETTDSPSGSSRWAGILTGTIGALMIAGLMSFGVAANRQVKPVNGDACEITPRFGPGWLFGNGDFADSGEQRLIWPWENATCFHITDATDSVDTVMRELSGFSRDLADDHNAFITQTRVQFPEVNDKKVYIELITDLSLMDEPLSISDHKIITQKLDEVASALRGQGVQVKRIFLIDGSKNGDDAVLVEAGRKRGLYGMEASIPRLTVPFDEISF